MSVPYVPRLLVLCLGSFFLVHLALGLLTILIAPAAVALAGRMRSQPGALFLLALRLFPAAFTLILVAGICAPSYLWLEPKTAAEPMGWASLACAALGGVVSALSIARAARAARRSLLHARQCRRLAREACLSGEPIWVLEGASPLVMVSGILRPRLIISSAVMAALSAEQRDAVLRHEGAHRRSHDNLKRLLLILAPGVLPFVAGFGVLDRGWARIAEWAADDGAVAGDERRSLTLAAALVRVARLGAAPPVPRLASSLLAGGFDLSARVDRLLRPLTPRPGRGSLRWLSAAGVILALSSVAAIAQPATLYSAHDLLERFIQ